MSIGNLFSRFFLHAVAFTVAASAHTCFAHNSGVVVQGNAGKLVTGFIDESTEEHTIVQRAFPVLMPGSLADDFPGFLSQGTPPGGNDPLPVGGNLYWDFLPMNSDGVRSNLLYWDGIGSTVNDVDFGLVPTAGVSLSLYTETLLDFSTAHGTDEFVQGKYVGNVTSSSTTPLHAHLWSFIGSTTTVPEGIYLFSIRLTMEGYENSDALYVAAATDSISESTLYNFAMPWVENRLDTLVLPGDFDFDGKVDSQDFLQWQRDSSVGSLPAWEANHGAPTVQTTTAVPEPSALGLLSWGVVVFVRRSRRT